DSPDTFAVHRWAGGDQKITIKGDMFMGPYATGFKASGERFAWRAVQCGVAALIVILCRAMLDSEIKGLKRPFRKPDRQVGASGHTDVLGGFRVSTEIVDVLGVQNSK